MRLFLLFALLITSSFATNVNGEIITWGYGELIKNVFDSIQMLIKDYSYYTFVKHMLN